MTTFTAKDAVMSRSRMGTMSTTCTTVTFIDDTTITTTNANRPATPCMRITTTSTAKDAVTWPCRTGTMSTTCTTGAGTPRTASITTSTNAARPAMRFSTLTAMQFAAHAQMYQAVSAQAGRCMTYL